jgi:hypothetical protein
VGYNNCGWAIGKISSGVQSEIWEMSNCVFKIVTGCACTVQTENIHYNSLFKKY